jgi:hypothetical protein
MRACTLGMLVADELRFSPECMSRKLFSPECYEALAQELGVASPKPPPRREWPAGLTDREVEVLRCCSAAHYSSATTLR